MLCICSTESLSRIRTDDHELFAWPVAPSAITHINPPIFRAVLLKAEELRRSNRQIYFALSLPEHRKCRIFGESRIAQDRAPAHQSCTAKQLSVAGSY